MLDFTPVRQKKLTITELGNDLNRKDLQTLTSEMVNRMQELIKRCTDADVIFVPDDPDAFDPDAATKEELQMSWTLAHVIVHTTASAEEAAFLSAELARGAERREGRSRREVPWTSVTTIEACRQRLEESRRMRLASLDVWPDKPYFDNTYSYLPAAPKINAIGQFLFGLMHDDSHLDQIADIVKQASQAREVNSQ